MIGGAAQEAHAGQDLGEACGGERTDIGAQLGFLHGGHARNEHDAGFGQAAFAGCQPQVAGVAGALQVGGEGADPHSVSAIEDLNHHVGMGNARLGAIRPRQRQPVDIARSDFAIAHGRSGALPALQALLLKHEAHGFGKNRSISAVALRLRQVDLHPGAHGRAAEGLEGDDMRVLAQQAPGGRSGQLEPHASLIEAGAQLFAGVVSRVAEHFAGAHQGMGEEQAIQDGLEVGVKV